MKRYSSFVEFWPFYVMEHSKFGTRLLHFSGISLLFLFLLAATYRRSLVLVIPGVVAAYGFAWIGHFFVERNKPATFRYPIYSLLAVIKMYSLILAGKMQREVDLYLKAT